MQRDHAVDYGGHCLLESRSTAINEEEQIDKLLGYFALFTRSNLDVTSPRM